MTEEKCANVPDHVPAHLVRDFDFLRMPEGEEVFEWFGQLHNGPDIFFTPRNEGHWVFTRHADIEHALKTYDDFSSTYMSIPKSGMVLPIPPIDLDPPMHADYRRLIAPFFGPKAIDDLETVARRLTGELIDSFYASGECEFMNDFAFKMPIGIFLSLVDLPEEDRLPLIDMAHRMIRGDSEIQRTGFVDSFAYLAEKLAERRVKPGNDILTGMTMGKVADGRALTQDELLGMGALLLSGGLDTVASSLGFIVNFLATHPAERRQLAERPEIVPHALEELLRRFEGVNNARMVARDIRYNDVHLRQGDMVLMSTTLAGIDERRYPDARTVDFARIDRKTLSFGRGPHQCVGAFLARTELRVFLVDWLKRIPDFEIDQEGPLSMSSGRTCIINRLPLRWNVKN